MPVLGMNSKSCWPAEGPNAAAAGFVWRTKYQAPGERRVADTWRRVARAVAGVEADAPAWERRFFELLEGFRFLPGGRILAGAGVTADAVLNNCFVMGPVGDDLDGILKALRESIRTLMRGGGIGCDFSTVPPCGERTDAPGPVAVMALWEAACVTFLGRSPRQGAMMGTLRCDHPDIESFVAAKRQSGALSHFNISVLVTDAFMAAVKDDAGWPLIHDGRVFRTVKAWALWDAIAEAAHAGGEPGVLFIDRINQENNLRHRERITATNPCGEVPLPPYGACDLGSLNLTAFVREAFTPAAQLDLAALAAASRVAVRFLDNVIDLTAYPLAAQRDAARTTRRIGLGVTGLADALLMLGLRYGGGASLEVAAAAMRTIRDAAYGASTALAREKAPFPAFDRDACLKAPFILRLPAKLRQEIAVNGLRNSHLLAIAPTGSISLLAGGISTGIEPVFAAVQSRTMRDARGATHRFEFVDTALALWQVKSGARTEPPGFVTADALPVAAHVAMQAALQPLVDGAISKTINLPADCSVTAFRQAFDLAYERGLKGCAAFRPNTVRGPLLCKPTADACD